MWAWLPEELLQRIAHQLIAGESATELRVVARLDSRSCAIAQVHLDNMKALLQPPFSLGARDIPGGKRAQRQTLRGAPLQVVYRTRTRTRRRRDSLDVCVVYNMRAEIVLVHKVYTSSRSCSGRCTSFTARPGSPSKIVYVSGSFQAARSRRGRTAHPRARGGDPRTPARAAETRAPPITAATAALRSRRPTRASMSRLRAGSCSRTSARARQPPRPTPSRSTSEWAWTSRHQSAIEQSFADECGFRSGAGSLGTTPPEHKAETPRTRPHPSDDGRGGKRRAL